MTQMKIVKKRFIAAAVCPACDAVDRILVEVAVLHSDDGDVQNPDAMSRRRCVACGFTEEFSSADRIGFQGLPKGRPERPKTTTVNPVKVRILDPDEPGL